MLLFTGIFYTSILLVVTNYIFWVPFLFKTYHSNSDSISATKFIVRKYFPPVISLPVIPSTWVLFCSQRNGAVSHSPLFFFRLFFWLSVKSLFDHLFYWKYSTKQPIFQFSTIFDLWIVSHQLMSLASKQLIFDDHYLITVEVYHASHNHILQIYSMSNVGKMVELFTLQQLLRSSPNGKSWFILPLMDWTIISATTTILHLINSVILKDKSDVTVSSSVFDKHLIYNYHY